MICATDNPFMNEVQEAFSAMADAQERARREKTMTLAEREAERQRIFAENYEWREFELRRKQPAQTSRVEAYRARGCKSPDYGEDDCE